MTEPAQSPTEAEDHFMIWDTVSMAWTEIGLDDAEYPKIAARLHLHYRTWRDIDRVIQRDVIPSFALDSTLVFLILVPILQLVLINVFPDWGYSDTYLRERIQRWQRTPRWRLLLNPLRWLGYPLAWMFVWNLRRKLRRAFIAYADMAHERI